MYGYGSCCSPMNALSIAPLPIEFIANSLFSSFGYNQQAAQSNPFAGLINQLNGNTQPANYSNFQNSYASQPNNMNFGSNMNMNFSYNNNGFDMLNMDFSNLFNFKPSYTTSQKNNTVRMSGNLGKDTVKTAKSYIGYKESDNSYKLFTKGNNREWCADFVTHVVKETYTESGKQAPAGFGSPSVENLRQWGKKNDCYYDITRSSDRAKDISQNVKAGDVIIFKNSGASHTGIVASVNSDGSFTTVEGNTTDKVAQRSYKANNPKISRFVQLA